MNDRYNPLFVYEIRQVVRNPMALAFLCLHLAALVFLTGLHLYGAIETGRAVGLDDRIGGLLAFKILGLLHCTSLGFLTAYSFSVTKNQGLDEELLFTTGLNARTAMFGKLQTAALLTALFYTTSLPFLTIAWMLRGVDLLGLLLTMAVMFTATQIMVHYVAGAFIRCRSTVDVVASFFALLIGSPPLLLLVFGVPLLFGGFAHGGSLLGGRLGAYQAMIVVPLTFFALAALSLVTCPFTKEMYAMNWAYLPAERRFGVIAVCSWFIGYVVLMIGLLLAGLFLLIVFFL